jgi:hypothetical protein
VAPALTCDGGVIVTASGEALAAVTETATRTLIPLSLPLKTAQAA